MSALMYDLDVLDGTSDILCTCCVGSSHWHLICSSVVLTRTPSAIWGKSYLPMFYLGWDY